LAKRIGMILSGCGVFDGSEIHEAVLSYLHLARRGYEVVFLAPNKPQFHVVDHLKGAPAEGETRNVLTESARIARGKIRDLATARASEFDGLFLPGGFGAAKNLCTYAFDGPAAKVDPEVARLIGEMREAGKPMAFVCIAPALAAKLIPGVEVTIGNDPGTAAAIAAMGGCHVAKPVDQAHVDRLNKVVSAPAYMYDATIVEVDASVAAAVEAFAGLVG
jgi:enhancing lycopene biosynthesis protein 2